MSVFHESIPYKSGSKIFYHQNRNSHIDSNHILVIPIFVRIKCIYKTISMPRTRGKNGIEPAVAHGTTLPSIGP
ncbi:hypothetical protein BpHYR1_011797 [Brachionus plicatilis]|uniref:Uncharacterized protein n=1 Tax=Brachionus plicatilis TaxID=10195 RepID=A0A3M7T8R1_BRAPC|nr:hypothetical protein BpHYR1_011797 [Brachionus plicatilis]